MSFFEPPPPPKRPEPPFKVPEPKAWWGAPKNEIGTPVPLRLILGRTDQLAVALVGATAYTTGVSLDLVLRSRGTNGELFLDPMELSLMHPRMRRQHGEELPAELLRFGVQFADGRKATTVEADTRWGFPGEAEEEEPSGPVLTQGGGGGGNGEWSFTYWLWPLPPPGPLTFAVEWPAKGIELTTHEVDASLILEASKNSEKLWPDEGQSGGGPTVNQIILRSVDEPDEPESF